MPPPSGPPGPKAAGRSAGRARARPAAAHEEQGADGGDGLAAKYNLAWSAVGAGQRRAPRVPAEVLSEPTLCVRLSDAQVHVHKSILRRVPALQALVDGPRPEAVADESLPCSAAEFELLAHRLYAGEPSGGAAAPMPCSDALQLAAAAGALGVHDQVPELRELLSCACQESCLSAGPAEAELVSRSGRSRGPAGAAAAARRGSQAARGRGTRRRGGLGGKGFGKGKGKSFNDTSRFDWHGSTPGGQLQPAGMGGGAPPLPAGPVPALSVDEAKQMAPLSYKAGDATRGKYYADVAASLEAASKPAEINVHQQVQQQHAAVRRLEKQLESQLTRLLKWKQETAELEEQVRQSRDQLGKADEEYKAAVERLRDSSGAGATGAVAASGPCSTPAIPLRDIMEGKFDLTSILKFDIMEEFESSEYDVTDGDRKEYQTRLEKLQTGVQDLSKSLFEQLTSTAAEETMARDFLIRTLTVQVAVPLQVGAKLLRLLSQAPRLSLLRGLPPLPQPLTSELGPQSCGLDEGLLVSTVNANCWGTLKNYLTSSVSHIVIAQEHRLRGDDDIATASKGAKFLGWKSLWAPGIVGEGGGTPPGVGVFVRDALGMFEHQDKIVLAEGRAIAAMVHVPGCATFCVFSLYLRHSEGARALHSVITPTLKCKLAMDKVGMVSSSKHISAALSAELGDLVGDPACTRMTNLAAPSDAVPSDAGAPAAGGQPPAAGAEDSAMQVLGVQLGDPMRDLAAIDEVNFHSAVNGCAVNVDANTTVTASVANNGRLRNAWRVAAVISGARVGIAQQPQLRAREKLEFSGVLSSADGVFQSMELLGPPTLEDWVAAYSVACLTVLETVSPARPAMPAAHRRQRRALLVRGLAHCVPGCAASACGLSDGPRRPPAGALGRDGIALIGPRCRVGPRRNPWPAGSIMTASRWSGRSASVLPAVAGGLSGALPGQSRLRVNGKTFPASRSSGGRGRAAVPNYSSAAKGARAGQGFERSDCLDRGARRAPRSGMRGIGGPQQDAEIDFDDSFELQLGSDALARGSPVRPGRLCEFACFFIPREVEAPLCLARSVALDSVAMEVIVALPVSASGAGVAAEKRRVVAAVEAIATRLGQPLKDDGAATGMADIRSASRARAGSPPRASACPSSGPLPGGGVMSRSAERGAAPETRIAAMEARADDCRQRAAELLRSSSARAPLEAAAQRPACVPSRAAGRLHRGGGRGQTRRFGAGQRAPRAAGAPPPGALLRERPAAASATDGAAAVDGVAAAADERLEGEPEDAVVFKVLKALNLGLAVKVGSEYSYGDLRGRCRGTGSKIARLVAFTSPVQSRFPTFLLDLRTSLCPASRLGSTARRRGQFARVNPAETVGELKARLEEHPEDGTPRQDDQRLVANGAVMDEARSLGSFRLCGWSRQKDDVAEVRAVHHLKACAKAGGGAPKGRIAWESHDPRCQHRHAVEAARGAEDERRGRALPPVSAGSARPWRPGCCALLERVSLFPGYQNAFESVLQCWSATSHLRRSRLSKTSRC
ncbi:unnamed protein product [Prorocentrum cordatum]|uniref:Ubiquitin-like domain-containing protein n=1 Tax=Prorocentrum cordatum TaxID=2364126 RepID=A0ABN9R488_9DINO|nr:unnamed protein product [Polarella glacialis]